MMCASPVKSWLYALLTLWLLLTIARQVFDLIGKLWLPVVFNLLQTIACITGLFAICQYRLCLLVCLISSSTVSLFYNTFILLWYTGVFGERSRPWLSAGLPYSYSFFLRHTPFCNSHFNLTASVWVQSDCILPYYQLEGFQAILHIVLSLTTTVLAAVLLVSLKRDRKTYEKKHMSGVKIHVGGSAKGSCLQLNPPDSINDISSGYMNSSYDSKEHSMSSDPKKKLYGNFERYAQRQLRTSKLVAPTLETNNYSLASTREIQNHGESCHAVAIEPAPRFSSVMTHEDAWSDREDASVAYTRPHHRSGSVKSFKQMKAHRASLRDQASMRNSEHYGSTVSNLSTFKRPKREQIYQDVPVVTRPNDRTKSEESLPLETAPGFPSCRTTPDWVSQAGIPHPNETYGSTYSSPPNAPTIYEPVYRSSRNTARSPPSAKTSSTYGSSNDTALSVADLGTTGMRLMAYSSEPRSRHPIVATEDNAGGFVV